MSKYNQIYTDLLASIPTERLQRGTRLPTETELMDTYQATRGTVRRAIEQLQERECAQEIHGKGTCVLSRNPIELKLGGIVSFHETNGDLGDDVRTEVVEFTRVPLEGSLLQHIEAEPGTLITR
ncbi:GntR family transcriptional regulator, partial [Colwellia sp. TT2012]|uniref:GntR family transcriptional regulator n=1 Tax=Colwellia sp. TT2012 TaxID=1720342 RepID=UPI000AED586C